MGFRLSSAIAGFATRTSENLDELQNKADDIAKTAAARYADEAIQVRKERMKSRQEYLDAATMLQNNFNLSNNQVESILSGGVANKDLFIQKMKDIEDQQFAAGKSTGQDMNTWKFNNNAAISEIFKKSYVIQHFFESATKVFNNTTLEKVKNYNFWKIVPKDCLLEKEASLVFGKNWQNILIEKTNKIL